MDDQLLVEAGLRGERDAFAQLVRKYQAPLVAAACHLLHHRDDAEDLAQEAFVEAYRRLHTLREGEKFAAWLFTILRRKCLHHLRRRRHHESLEAFSDTLAAPPPPDDSALLDALYRLPLPDREVLAARYLLELDYGEVAGTLGIEVNAARMRCFRARERLRHLMQEADEERTRLLMQRAMGLLLIGGFGEAFTNRVLQEVSQLPITLAPQIAAQHGIGQSLWPNWITHLAAGKVAAGVTSLLVIAGVAVTIGSIRRHNLLAANFAGPRVQAVAATGQPAARGAVDPALTAPALQQAITVEADGHRVGEVLATIGKQLGVTLTAGLQVTDQRLFLRLRGMPAARVLTLIGEQLHLTWQVTAAGVYALDYTDASRAALAAEQTAQRKLARAEAEHNLRTIRRMLVDHVYDPSVLHTTSAWLARNVDHYINQTKGSPSNYMPLVLLLDDADIAGLMAHDASERKSVAGLTADKRALLQGAVDEMNVNYGDGQKHSEMSAKATYAFELCIQPTGSLDLLLSFKSGDKKGSGYGVYIGTLYEGWEAHPTGRETVQPAPELARLLAEATARNRAYADPRLRVPVTVSLRSLWSPEVFAGVLRGIAETERPVASDYFSLLMSVNSEAKETPVRATMAEWLALLDLRFNIAWSFTTDGVLVLRHRCGIVLREGEPPLPLVDALARSYQAHGGLTVADVGRLSSLDSFLRISGGFCAVRERLGNPKALAQAQPHLMSIALEGNRLLTVYGMLTDDQRALAARPQGLPVADLTPEQRRIIAEFVVRAERGVDNILTPAAVLARPLRLHTRCEQATYQELTQLVGQGFRSVYIDGQMAEGGQDVPADYLLIEVIGTDPDVVYCAPFPVESRNESLFFPDGIGGTGAWSANWADRVPVNR